MKTIKISDDALAVLSGCAIDDGAGIPTIRITDGQLDRKLYLEVNTVLQEIGGKWDKKFKGHVFAQGLDVRSRIDEVILAGEIAPLSKNGFFPTPALLAATLVTQARIKSGHRILEPSAGTGVIIDAILTSLGTHVRIDTTIRAIEINEKLARGLVEKYKMQPVVLAVCMPFLEWTVEGPPYLYDRIVMNPPFENRADAKHILHAYSLLKPGGRLVSVASSGVKFRRETEYQRVRELAEIEDLPAGSFKESGTMVNTVLVIIDKK